MTRVNIGLNISPQVAPDRDPVAEAVRAEQLGFDFVSLNDHIHASGPRYEAWTLMTWIAAATRRVRVASRVLGVPYRHPAVLAKMAESFDRLSGGRLILGLGAGASEEEFGALGLGQSSPGGRFAGLEEAIHVMRGLWSSAGFTFAGGRYRTHEAVIEPAPMRPIPIWLGTHGPRGLELTGRLADGWIPSIELAPPDAVPGMLGRITDAARAAGRDPAAITRTYNVVVSLDGGAHGPFLVSGSPETVAERLAGFWGLGFTALNVIVAGSDPGGQVELLAREVLPAIRAAAMMLNWPA
ncbi:MAG TPA: LLM class flavin-dependent oxidoreductase [Actinomycetes bacterium]|jgi:alkanesulfonate monooxygenase SsuD/methylene tetrahydromethanopterin reductase-like flavin-dependent oxidoreductase (luciferase family)|nr:LLM class flavin-dependent oxidoreductase [Actinomycetes bacterium]